MPEKFQGPSGAVYVWEKDTPPTQADIDAMVAADMQRGAAHATMKTQWQYGGPADRIALMAKWGADTLVDLGIEGAAAALGQAVGDRVGGPARKVTGPLGGAIGGATGNFIVQAKNVASGEQDEIEGGQIAGAFTAGLIPQKRMSGPAASTVTKEAMKGATGNVAAKVVETEIDDGRLPTAGEVSAAAGGGAMAAPLARGAEAFADKAGVVSRASKAAEQAGKDARRNQTLTMAMQLGYTLDPALANPTAINKLTDRVAGLTQTQRAAVFKNQQVTNEIARQEIGLPSGKPITKMALFQRRYELAEPYREVANISPAAADALKQLQRARLESTAHWRKYGKDGDIDFRDKAEVADKTAEALENTLENFAVRAGKNELVGELREARKKIAKAHAVESALNDSDGNVSALVIGTMYDKGVVPLTDGLAVIGRLENTMPQVMREAAITQPVGTASFKPWIATALGAQGYRMGGIPGAAFGAAIPTMVEHTARGMVLRPTYQKFMSLPTYASSQPSGLESFIRYTSQTAGRK